MSYLIEDLTHLKQGPGAAPHCVWQTADRMWQQSLLLGGRRRLPFIGGINVRLAHQLPGKPAAGTGSKQVGNYY